MNSEQIFSKFFSEKAFSRNKSRERLLLIERMYQRILIELCVNRFNWTGLPTTVDVRYLEMTLFSKALCVFYWDKEFNRYLTLNASGVGKVNMYDNPTKFTVIGNTMVNKELSPSECVPIWANYTRSPDLDIVLVYANRLAEIDRTIEINTKQLRRNKLVFASQNTRLSMANLDRQIDEGQEKLYVTKGTFEKGDIDSIDIGVDSHSIETLIMARERTWANAMTMLGINNFNTEKKERLVSAEVDGGDEQIDQMKNIALNARQQACKRIKEMYPNLDVWVEYGSQSVPALPPINDLGEVVGLGELETQEIIEEDEV